jgi:hypothetical protein
VKHGHADLMPASHRRPRKVRQMHVHNDLNATSFPGNDETDHKAVTL